MDWITISVSTKQKQKQKHAVSVKNIPNLVLVKNKITKKKIINSKSEKLSPNLFTFFSREIDSTRKKDDEDKLKKSFKLYTKQICKNKINRNRNKNKNKIL